MTLKEMIENFKKKVESHPHYQETIERLKKAAEASKSEQNKTEDK
jgi:hypothetical protein